ncbi:hypothetical protein F4781DRAFT_410046 [Annulohypoxylon bovei var. microspora]|nr:hypothetical protein F4781DRAFT_410046 [Annulohypoxylon bovei var. microspora]
MSINTMPLDVIKFCNLCNKPIATESAYKRHASYCRRTRDRPRKRPRSCKECHSAKVKCSFEPECSRCKYKGLRCIYEKPVSSSLTAKENGQSGGLPSPADSHGLIMERPIFSLARISSRSSISNFGSSTSLDVPPSSPRSIVALRADPVAQQSAKFILESFRALPLTMVSREAFSWFSHGYWFQPKLLQNIARCSEVANLYVDRKSLPADSFWTIINQENRRFLRELPSCSLREVLSGMQAQIVYMIMFALDNISSHDTPEITLQMLMTFELYGKKAFELDCNVWFPLDDPNMTWEDWVYIETQRRCTTTWFLLSRVIDLKFGVMCSSVSNCRRLQLPAPGSLWNARTRGEWEAARQIHCRDQMKLLRTFGDLIEARSCPPNSDHGQELNRWHASCDKLGLLLALATTMV